MTEGREHVEELLDRYRTGELDPAERRRVEDHLEGCEGCRSALAALEAFSKTVERGYAAATGARSAGREPDWGRLRAAIVERTSGRKPGPRRFRLARHAPQAAVAVLALVALGVLWQQGIRGPADADRALRDDRPSAASDGDAMSADGDAGAMARPEADEAGATTGAELGRARSDPTAEPELAKRDAPDEPRRELETGEGAAEREAAAAAQKPVPAAEAIRQRAEAVDAEAREDVTVSGFRIEARPDSAAVAGEAEVVDEVAVTRNDDATTRPDLERFERRARRALSEADSALASEALTQWRDSLASGAELPADLRAPGQALADSLAAFLVRRPDAPE